MTTQTQSTVNLQTLTTFITSHLPSDVAINIAQDKLETYGYIVFRFSHPMYGYRNIKFIPDSTYWYVKVTPIYSNHYMDEESETIDLYNVWEWLAWRIPSIFPQVEQEKTADDLAWEEACRADDEAWQNGQTKLIEQIVEARNRASAMIQKSEVQVERTVSNTVKGDIPSLFSNWVIIASTTYDAKYGDKYTILATKSKDSQNFLDIICDTNNNYITLGSERYSQTLEITERMSLLAEADRLGY